MADIAVARSGAAALTQPAHAATWLIASAGMMLVLLAPAFWNGFPLIFPDTGGYLTRPIEGVPALGRSALYGWFLYLGMPLAFWPVIIAQAAATAWTIVLTLRCHVSLSDLLGSGTVSGPTRDSRGCLLELTWRGSEPIQLGDETRRFLEDGDEVVFRGWCERPGRRRIGFGECRGTIRG